MYSRFAACGGERTAKAAPEYCSRQALQSMSTDEAGLTKLFMSLLRLLSGVEKRIRGDY